MGRGGGGIQNQDKRRISGEVITLGLVRNNGPVSSGIRSVRKAVVWAIMGTVNKKIKTGWWWGGGGGGGGSSKHSGGGNIPTASGVR